MDRYVVKELETREEMDAVVDLIYEAQYRPYMPSAQILFPVFGYLTSDRAKSIQQTKLRLWNDHKESGSSKQWICVKDKQTGSLLAATVWEWYENSPFPDGKPKLDLEWWPDCPAKGFCEEIFQQTMIPRCLWMKRRHGGLSNMVVHPDHRSKGLGGLMMDWGNQRLDEEGIEGFLEASELGRALYEKWGYQPVMKLDFFLPLKMPTEWNKLAHEMKMPAWYAMWRPAKGKVAPGERDRPWQ